MNKTNFEHLFVALIIQLIGWLLFDDLVIGAAFATGIFLGREHSQREENLMSGDRSALVGYEALDFWKWNKDELLDLIFPVAGVWLVVIFRGLNV